MTKAQLIEFRAKLVRARLLHCFITGYTFSEAIRAAGLWCSWTFDLNGCNFEWLERARRFDLITMWNNSIAHVDKLIKEAK